MLDSETPARHAGRCRSCPGSHAPRGTVTTEEPPTRASPILKWCNHRKQHISPIFTRETNLADDFAGENSQTAVGLCLISGEFGCLILVAGGLPPGRSLPARAPRRHVSNSSDLSRALIQPRAESDRPAPAFVGKCPELADASSLPTGAKMRAPTCKRGLRGGCLARGGDRDDLSSVARTLPEAPCRRKRRESGLPRRKRKARRAGSCAARPRRWPDQSREQP
jgi:hypothetical protein